jgi:hypothetical protein
MAKVLTRAQLIQARGAVEDYVKQCNSIYQSLEGTLTSLTSTNWTGDAADGCLYFFNSHVTPLLTEQLKELTDFLNEILLSIEDACLDKVDPQLGDANRNPGGA